MLLKIILSGFLCGLGFVLLLIFAAYRRRFLDNLERKKIKRILRKASKSARENLEREYEIRCLPHTLLTIRDFQEFFIDDINPN